MLKKIVCNGWQIIVFKDGSFIIVPSYKHTDRRLLTIKNAGLESYSDTELIRFCMNAKLINNND